MEQTAVYQAIIIDDEKWVVKSLKATLQDMEHLQITRELYDGIAAMRYLEAEQPDLAFIDVRLPGMDGLEILRQAKDLGLRTLFIVISGHAEFAYAQKAMLHNAIGYCLKPFSHDELTDAINKAYQILEERRKREEAAENAAMVFPQPPPSTRLLLRKIKPFRVCSTILRSIIWRTSPYRPSPGSAPSTPTMPDSFSDKK